MRSHYFRIFFEYGIYSLTVFLTFLLVFERFLVLPELVNWIGRWHPLILHFPIVLILVTIIQYWRKDPDVHFYLTATTFFTLISAITGLILSMENASKGTLVLTHQWMGVTLSFLMILWYFLRNTIQRLPVRILHGGLIGLIIFTGHFGGTITHGKDFLSLADNNVSERITLPENPNMYRDIVQPVLNDKCVACHNANKGKGGLILTDFESLTAGGESGSVFDEQKGLLYRIELPLSHKDHMPPTEEKQLTDTELNILREWIRPGASKEVTYNDLDEKSVLHGIVRQMIDSEVSEQWNGLPKISDGLISKLVSDYCTIRRLYRRSNALQVLVFPHESYNSEVIQKLKPISKNIIELDVSNLRMGREEISTVSSFNNLESLNISGSSISDENFKTLATLEKLRTLKAYETDLSDEILDHIVLFGGLEYLYIYNTKISDHGIDQLKRNNRDLHVVTVVPEALDFKSALPSPTINPEKHFFRDPFHVKLTHPLKEIELRYTTDGMDPDTNSALVRDSLYVDKSFTLKYFASKEGWQSSPVDSISLFLSQCKPESYDLVHAPNSKYTGRGKTLLFDLEKGPENFGDSAWMAFKEKPFVLTCTMDGELVLKKVVLSSLVHTDPYIFPPSSIKVFGGEKLEDMTLIGKATPLELRDRRNLHFTYFFCEVNATPIRYLKIVIQPLQKIPNWHQGKGQRGWFFIDEVVFIGNRTDL